MNKQHIEECIKGILQEIGENPNREGLIGTPDRIARMYTEIFRGYDEKQAPKITTFRNGVDGIAYSEAVYDTGKFYSMCEHHMMPFFGTYTFAYMPAPHGKILGLSKIARVVDYCSAKLQLQERLCYEVVSMLERELRRGENAENYPKGLIIQMRAKHLCKSMRGSKKEGIMMATYATGVFRDPQKRAEFERECIIIGGWEK